MKRLKKSTIIPLALLVYLGGMAYIGRAHFTADDRMFYFGILGVTFVIIILLHFLLKKKEKYQPLQKERDVQAVSLWLPQTPLALVNLNSTKEKVPII